MVREMSKHGAETKLDATEADDLPLNIRELIEIDDAGRNRPPFVFLSIFKWEDRKGWRQLLKAFWAEFWEEVGTVRLVIKTSFNCKPSALVKSGQTIQATQDEAIGKEEDKEEEQEQEHEEHEEHEEEAAATAAAAAAAAAATAAAALAEEEDNTEGYTDDVEEASESENMQGEEETRGGRTEPERTDAMDIKSSGRDIAGTVDDTRQCTTPQEDVAAWAWELGIDTDVALSLLLLTTTPLSSGKLADLYRGADAFALATHGEGWGLPLLEAMACGLPTIATDWGGQLDFMSPATGCVIYLPARSHLCLDFLAGKQH
jgi:glycosyltransferase involved in cell wall biosynthesis